MRDLSWMIYGANGYTGRWIAQEAVGRGLRPILAGRSAEKIESLAAELGCESRVFRLGRADRIAEHLTGLSVVLNCAGPFSATGEPMMDACLQAGTNYLDITGEIDVIEAAAARHDRAVRVGLCLIPAVGFDVVPSDCLAAMLARRLPDATHLQLAFMGPGRISPGTAKTMLAGLGSGGRVRIDGRITKVPTVWKTMNVPFRYVSMQAVTVPWGDVASAWHTTGIPNIEVYVAVPPQQIKRLRAARWVFPLLGLRPIRAILGQVIQRRVTGPTPQRRKSSRASFWGRVSDEQGNSVEATLESPGGYRLTVATALESVERILAGTIKPGFSTPVQAFGEDFILNIPETDFRYS